VNDTRPNSEAQTRTAGRGVLSITGAKLYFIVGGYAVQLLLPRLLGTPEAFGLYSSAMNLVSILNNVLVAATVQSVSKHVSEDLTEAGATLRQGLLLQLTLGGALAIALWALAPVLASDVLLDPLLTPLLAVSAIVVFCYALYATLVGALNGQQRFSRQAALDGTYTTLRTVLILGGATFGALGAMIGFAGAASGVLLVALVVVGTGKRGRAIPWRRWFLFLAPLWLYQLCLSLTLQVDLSVIKAVVAAMGREAGMLAQTAAETASRLTGFYRAAQTFAFVPYQLIISVAFVVFPMVSHAVSIGDHEATRRYIGGAMRFSLIVLLAVAAPVSGAADGVMRLAYPDAYLAGSEALAVLALGTVCFALFAIGATIMNGAGRPGVPAAIAVGTVVVVVACNLLFLRMAGIGEHTLLAAAAGTSAGMAASMVAIAVAVHMRFGIFIAPMSVLRISSAGVVAWLVARAVPSHSAAFALAALIAGGISFLLALVVSRELGASDFDVLRRITRRR
jgi:stage V sporulation protein B